MSAPPPFPREPQSESWDSPQDLAGQHRPSRSSFQGLEVRAVAAPTIAPLMTDHHYLHAMPRATRRCFKVFQDGQLVGGAVFTIGSRHAGNLLSGADPRLVATLARFWLADTVPPNGESRVLGVILRQLKRETSWKALVSYADPAAGHRGTIYQATGWLYLGATTAERYVELADGSHHHPRSIFTRYGTNSPDHLNRTGVPARRVWTPPKHRYLYVLDPSWRWRVRLPAQPYPKDRGPP